METYYGHVRTPADAIILFEACRIGLVPRVQRRLSEKERQAIRSGSVFVWDEREAGMRRWTDGKSWSASRVSGSFLTYREMEGKRGGGSVSVARAGKTPESTRGSDDDRGNDVDDGPDGYRYKPDGLMKQSFSITTSAGQHLHLISYYARSDPAAPNLRQPSTDPNLRHVRPQKGLYPESTVNDQQNLPVVTRGPMAGATYSITPHPLGPYARPAGATHPQSYTPQYAWPPTPMPTPQTVAVPYGAPYMPSVSASNGLPPYAHQPLPPPSQQGFSSPYDRPLHAVEASLPPQIHHPPPPNNHPPSLPVYAGRSPRASAGGDPHEIHPSLHQNPGYDPRMGSSPHHHPQPQPQPIPQHNGAPPYQTTAAHSSPTSHNPIYLPAAGGPGPAIKPDPAPPASSSGSQLVPSIGALVNGAPHPQSGGGSLPALSSAAASAPPGPGPGLGGIPDGPKDIPSEKLRCGGEDKRALRQLDRVFTA